jgi:Lipid A 3-O-deacylase (PagL)
MVSRCVVLAAALAVLAAPGARAADFCATCEVQLGAGFTYHFWQWTHSPVIPVTLDFDRDRWELGAFRFTHSQEYYNTTFGANIRFTTPYWGFSLSRRVELFRHPHWRVILGLGASYKTEEDRLSSSYWNIAEQFGVRLTPASGWTIDLLGRHWSNGGLKLPNHGEDFATVTVSVFPGLIGRSHD